MEKDEGKLIQSEILKKKKKKKKRGQKVNKKTQAGVIDGTKSLEDTPSMVGKKRKIDDIEEIGSEGEEKSNSHDKAKKKKKKQKQSEKPDDLNPNLDSSRDQQDNNGENEDEIVYPYEVQSDDHCETPIEAYEDLGCFLNFIAEKLNKSREELFIYDPFFCEGSMVERMGSLGYKNVYNRKEDFYQVQANNAVPDYDVLMTNPPYSQDHMEKLVRFCVQSRKPFALLVPNYVYTKDYFERIPGTNQIFYITPSNGRRYLYTTPKGRRQKKSSKYTSPFPTFWFCHIPPQFPALSSSPINPHAPPYIPPAIIQQVRQQAARIELARTKMEIPISVAPDNDPRKKKLRNNLKRKKNKDRKKQA